ncbi:Trypanosomal VSG domain [Trypanosoma vivax]|nr:Trypanosomal VSG domain [Trypanosoma vivax]
MLVALLFCAVAALRAEAAMNVGSSSQDFAAACAALKTARSAAKEAASLRERVASWSKALGGINISQAAHIDTECAAQCDAATVASTLAKEIERLAKIAEFGRGNGDSNAKPLDFDKDDESRKALFKKLTGAKDDGKGNAPDIKGNDASIGLTLVALCNNAQSANKNNICRATAGSDSNDGSKCPCMPKKVAGNTLKDLLPDDKKSKGADWTQLKLTSGGINMGRSGDEEMQANWLISKTICDALYPDVKNATAASLGAATQRLMDRIRYDQKTEPEKRHCLGYLDTAQGCDWTAERNMGGCICYDASTTDKKIPAFISTLQEQHDKLRALELLATTTHAHATTETAQRARQTTKHEGNANDTEARGAANTTHALGREQTTRSQGTPGQIRAPKEDERTGSSKGTENPHDTNEQESTNTATHNTHAQHWARTFVAACLLNAK